MSVQCHGVTKQNTRCKKQVFEGNYCHYHQDQDQEVKIAPGSAKVSTASSSNKKTDKTDGKSYKPSKNSFVHNIQNLEFSSKNKKNQVAASPTTTTTTTKVSSGNGVKKTKKQYDKVYNIKLSNKPSNYMENNTDTINVENEGFIYVYTLKHLLSPNPSKKDWVQIENSSNNNRRANSEFISNKKWESFDPKNHILLKIGLTTQSVQKRIKQWETQCKCDLIIVEPLLFETSVKFINSGLKLLNLGDSKANLSNDPDRMNYNNFINLLKFKSYNNQLKGYYCPKNLYKIELLIHDTLREKYGKVNLYCENCGVRADDVDYKLHTEWFLVDRDDMKKVFKLVDGICYKNSL
ncbi:uncharacterized protein ASCRUDRAFT_71389 [Ascoidea rubescens DSM 1968]|uniref:Bacteriophage T5 Orf172 DNA-binding domain-containing protein n=1 Tax=Ascoidea rubescens DSM 1968 TaxID=1344418 RepID=A0A1D2VEH7_9ASCO|nr:hypothetical protein ASCRUDRAFT_71389 [Ascoidea rubescens DSM 1968]ODV59903.1 hypothetical protein ASCRUDRAFT_71389 [Ascoidea rubescens DSM 1968]